MNEMQDGLNQNVESMDIEIDFGRIFRSLLHYAWVIVLLSAIGAVSMYGYTKLMLAPVYKSTASLFIHDKIIASSDDIAVDFDDTVQGYNTVGGATVTYLQNTYRRTLMSDTTLKIVNDNLQLGLESKEL